jgi:5'(3')-deoxyribonucleotidase
MQPILFIDLDGVLVDLNSGLSEISGKNLEGLDKPAFKQTYYKFISSVNYDDLVNFWANLPPMPEYMKLWNKVKHLQPLILTAVTNNMANCEGKKKWVEKHLKISADRVFCAKKSRDKQFYASPKSILIDDYAKNIEEFKNKNGHGILHTHNKKTLSELKKVLKKWNIAL